MIKLKGSRLRAKGEKIEFDTDDGKKIYEIRPLKNKQLLEIVELADKKKGIESAILMAKYSLNADPRIVNGTEDPFDDEEMKELETPFLFQILKLASKVNKLEDMFDFQLRGQGGQPNPNPSMPTSKKPTLKGDLETLNQNPSKKVS